MSGSQKPAQEREEHPKVNYECLSPSKETLSTTNQRRSRDPCCNQCRFNSFHIKFIYICLIIMTCSIFALFHWFRIRLDDVLVTDSSSQSRTTKIHAPRHDWTLRDNVTDSSGFNDVSEEWVWLEVSTPSNFHQIFKTSSSNKDNNNDGEIGINNNNNNSDINKKKRGDDDDKDEETVTTMVGNASKMSNLPHKREKRSNDDGPTKIEHYYKDKHQYTTKSPDATHTTDGRKRRGAADDDGVEEEMEMMEENEGNEEEVDDGDAGWEALETANGVEPTEKKRSKFNRGKSHSKDNGSHMENKHKHRHGKKSKKKMTDHDEEEVDDDDGEDDDDMWLTSYFKVPIHSLSKFCLKTKDYCQGSKKEYDENVDAYKNGHDSAGVVRKECFQCPAGPPGRDGALGPPGEKGEPGENGKRGKKGPPGAMGLKGDIGSVEGGGFGMGRGNCSCAKGQKGEPGEKGVRGMIGFIGYKGEAGEPGPPGPAGPIVEGLQGPAGPPGLSGVKGQKGEPGIPYRPGMNSVPNNNPIDEQHEKDDESFENYKQRLNWGV